MTTRTVPGITSVTGHRRWDSRGRPTIEVVVTAGDVSGSALAPAGASTGTGEAVDLRDGGMAFGGYDVGRALRAVADVVAPALLGMSVTDQAAVDQSLREVDGTDRFATIGGNAAIATSVAVAQAAAAAEHVPLWRYLDPDAVTLPLPEIQIFGGGAHARGRLDVQDFLVVPQTASCIREAIEWAARVYRCAGVRLEQRDALCGVADEGGWWPSFDSNEDALELLTIAIEDAGFSPGCDVGIALDLAATQLYADGRYHLHRDHESYTRRAWLEVLLSWLDRFPIVSLEDPFDEDDSEGMLIITRAVGDRVQIVGDDTLVTDVDRIEQAVTDQSVNAVLIKPNQAGTLSQAHAAFLRSRAAGFDTIVSGRSGETEDVSIAHIAVGWGATGFKVGSIARGERTAKWNELLRIEESLGSAAQLAESRIAHAST